MELFVRAWLEEFLVVLSHSPRTQVALVLGVVFFVGVNLIGAKLLAGLDTTGVLGPMIEAVQEKLQHRYDRLAWFTLGSFWLGAWRLYVKDKRRLLCM